MFSVRVEKENPLQSLHMTGLGWAGVTDSALFLVKFITNVRGPEGLLSHRSLRRPCNAGAKGFLDCFECEPVTGEDGS